MGAETEGKQTPFLQKFDRVLSLLLSFCDKSKSSFSENISFLLDKSLDHLKILDTEDGKEHHNPPHIALIKTPSVKKFFKDVFKISKLPFIHSSITTFAINFLVELTKNEMRFKAMYSESPEVFDQIHQMTQTTIIENTEVKKSILSFYLSLSKFQTGRDWLLTTGSLSFTISSLSDRTVFIRKAAQESINYILPLLDEASRQKVLIELIEPILQVSKRLANNQIESDKLKPYFEVLEHYMGLTLSSNSQDKSGAFFSSSGAEVALHNIVSSAENEKMLSQAGTLLVAIYAKNALESDPDQSAVWENKTLVLIQLILRRGLLRPSLTVLSQSLVFWTHLRDAKSFHTQLVRLMIVPVLVDTEEVTDHFPEYKDVCQYWKNLAKGLTTTISDLMSVMLKSNNELNELTSISLAGLQKCIQKFEKELALKITRSSMFLLGCLKISDSKRMTVMPFAPQLAINLSKNLTSFIDVYNIRWWESYETVCLPIMFTRLVEYSSSRDTQVTCAGLEGLKFCIRQHIHPEQVLLLRNSPESTFNDMATVLHQCTVSVHWEVRDSAMEVVLEMTQLSHVKYPEFQNILIRSHLLEAALSAFNDIEAFVRASAISVVAAATPVPLLWEHLTAHSDVITSCYTILQQDSEALARRAAARALTLITKSEHFPLDQDRQILYRNMSAAAISDLDWEVKLQALEFWQVTIDETLRQQGMLDGSFPEITFSKEKQKIVRLDAAEIRSRLQNALTELGTCGCLNVLLQLVDDYDAPVREKSIQLLYYLRGVLATNHSLDLNIWQKNLDVIAPPSITSTENSPMVEGETLHQDADQVIDGILSVNDSSLINGILTNNEPKPRPNPVPVSAVSAQEFVNKVNLMELENMLETTWMSSDLHVIDFDSLLDDLQDCVHTDTSRPRPDCY